MKNTTMTARIYLPMAAMILTGALAVPAAEQKQVPFKGAIQGREIDTPQGGPPPTTLSVDGSVTGIANLVGQFSLAYKVTVSIGDGSGTGMAQLIAANGDTINLKVDGQGVPTDAAGVNSIVEIYTITGGTGQFAGANGSFTVERLVDLATGFTSGSFSGNITSPAK